MSRLKILNSIAVLLAASSLAAAAPLSGPAAVSDEKIARLESMHGRAEERILKNDFAGAIKIYDEILLEEPDDETAYTGMAQCQMVLGDFAHARLSYMNALHIDPDNETAKIGLEKIRDPDSMNFTETRTEKTPEKAEPLRATAPITEAAAPVLASPGAKMPASVEMPIVEMPMQENPAAAADSIALGARKTMAPYSVDTPVRGLTRGHQIQAALKNAGFYEGPIDGIIGPATRKAVRAFQTQYELAADGKVGPKTWELLQPFLNAHSLTEDTLKKTPRTGD